MLAAERHSVDTLVYELWAYHKMMGGTPTPDNLVSIFYGVYEDLHAADEFICDFLAIPNDGNNFTAFVNDSIAGDFGLNKIRPNFNFLLLLITEKDGKIRLDRWDFDRVLYFKLEPRYFYIELKLFMGLGAWRFISKDPPYWTVVAPGYKKRIDMVKRAGV